MFSLCRATPQCWQIAGLALRANPTTRRFRIRQWYAEKAANDFAGFGAGERFWQPKSYRFHIHSERKLREKLDYMHLNPVRARLVDRAEDWRRSSARWYLRQQTLGVPIWWPE